MASRSLDTLLPPVREAAYLVRRDLDDMRFQYVIACTRREEIEQEALWAQGRLPLKEVNALRLKAQMPPLKPKENLYKVSWTKGPIAPHVRGIAIDAYPLIGGKLAIETDLQAWKTLSDVFIRHGFTWGFFVVVNGKKVRRDWPHFEWKIKP